MEDSSVAVIESAPPVETAWALDNSGASERVEPATTEAPATSWGLDETGDVVAKPAGSPRSTAVTTETLGSSLDRPASALDESGNISDTYMASLKAQHDL